MKLLLVNRKIFEGREGRRLYKRDQSTSIHACGVPLPDSSIGKSDRFEGIHSLPALLIKTWS